MKRKRKKKIKTAPLRGCRVFIDPGDGPITELKHVTDISLKFDTSTDFTALDVLGPYRRFPIKHSDMVVCEMKFLAKRMIEILEVPKNRRK